MSTVSWPLKLFSRLFSDRSLTKKAYLNALTAVLEYAASLLVGFLITPLMVAGLGNYFFGMWQVLNRLVGYINPASGRPGFALKATLANQQASSDYDQKRRYVGSTLVIWLLFLPFLISVGGIVSWFVPYWIQAPAPHVWAIRAVTGLLVANLIVGSLSSIPQSTLQGENLGYKRMGMSVVLVFVGGGFNWLALYLGTGIIGIALGAVLATLANGLFFLWVVKNHAPWFGVARPRREDTRQLLGLSWWFMGWNLVTNLLLASDVVVLGFLHSIESVTNYSLTKYVPETLIGVIVIVIFGIVPGLGRIIGTGDHEKAIRLRSEINSFIWLTATTLGASILIWNRVFVTLWVGAAHYSGTLPNLLIVLAAMQLVFIRSDGNIIDLTLRMSQKVLLGFLAVIISIAAASLLVGYFRLGIAGLCVGIMAGRLILSLGYPRLIGRFLGVALSTQVNGILRPAIVTIFMFVLSISLDTFFSTLTWAGARGWFLFILSAGITGIVMLVLSFYAGLSSAQRGNIMGRLRGVMATAESV
jgi:O-antigen/teichoic acid export membrane protein